MKLAQWVILGAALGTVILTGFIHVGIREWYKADIRYEEGSYYRSGGLAVTSLRLENHGHSDAENLVITSDFPQEVVEVTTSEAAYRFSLLSGSEGSKSVSGTIPRLVPGQVLYVYFAIKDPGGPIIGTPNPFIARITYKGGQGKLGFPIWSNLGSSVIALIVGVVATASLSYVRVTMDKRDFPRHYEKLETAIACGIIARQKNVPEEALETDLSEQFREIRFRKQTLIEAGKKAYKCFPI